MKPLDVVFFKRIPVDSWRYEKYPDVTAALAPMLAAMKAELEKFDIELRCVDEEFTSVIKGYGELLNSMRISFPSAGVGSYCLGHIISASQNLDIVEDLKRGINRVAFAPETVEPSGSDKVVCHNCGCGC
ncbi:hypothetical protein SAMN02745165_02705 [Malonomonas rubra DSM 5091]|uniref:Uncharacterized protein n=1 Tax=Malonomonas rubra DSM 5091 TaxID=1122189 RepID=A0A1M6KG74_MALRU|nr:hypothetical protein [Malonomonas rubra]SHJ57907.1 hypothetical protein SAMN02745165_02705 [Malonomonas rubra DSM 5091]